LDRTRIEVKLLRIADLTPLATASFVPPRARGRLGVDLRSLNLAAATVSLEFFEEEERTGAAQLFLTARPCETRLRAGERIPVAIDVPEGAGSVERWPVTFGVPFPAGALWDAERVRLVNERGRAIPFQSEPTGLWAKEGAIQWLRFDALVSSEDGCFVEVGAPGEARPGPRLALTEKDESIIVDTGASVYVLGKGISPIMEIRLGGKTVASAATTRGLYVIDQTGRVGSASAEGEEIEVEARGPVASCVRFEGYYRTEKGEPLARHITRVENFAGRVEAKVTHTLVLCNSTTKCWFTDIGWELAATPGDNPEARFGVSRGDWRKTVSCPLSDERPSAYMLQDEHYFFAHGTNRCAVVALDRRGEGTTIVEGEECGDFACLAGARTALLVGCRDTARQHPKEFEVRTDKVTLHLFSSRGGEQLDFRTPTLVEKWDLVNWYKHTLPGTYVGDSEAIAERVKRTLPSDAIGWAKTHDLLITPLAPEKVADSARLAYLHSHEVYASVSPRWIYTSGAMGPLHPKDTKRFPIAEQYLDDTFRVWEKRLADWGDYGFVYYFTGPHLEYAGKYVKPFRYAALQTYTLRGDLWRAYARSGDRSIRKFAAASNRVCGDSIMSHWDGNGKVRGLFIYGQGRGSQPSDLTGNLPFHWEGAPRMQISSSSDMNNLIYLYQLTGDRRARDMVEEYAEGVKRFWTPARARRCTRSIMLMRMLVQTYGLTWDPALRELAEATTDIFSDPEGAIGLSKERPHRWTTYKTRVDIAGLLDAWQILGSPRYYDLSLKVADFMWGDALGVSPIFYVNNQGLFGQLLYAASGGDPSYPEALAVQLRMAGADYKPGTREIAGRVGAEDSTFVFQGIPYAQDLARRSGADKMCVASWVGYDDFGSPASIVAKKADQSSLEIDIRVEDSDGTVPPGVTVRPVKPSTRSGLDLLSVRKRSGHWSPFAKVRIPKDAPEGAYEITQPGTGSIFAMAHSKVPFVLHATEYWKPVPQSPVTRWYFSVPEECRDPQIFFEGKTRLYDPQGKPWQEGEAVKGWVNLPPAEPGVWAFEPMEHRLVRTRNIPPFFAARDSANYFVPDIPWSTEAPYQPPVPIPAERVYVPGALQLQDNKGLHLDGKRAFVLAGGDPHPSGDGLRFLPFSQGTIEFFFKPDWSTFDLSDRGSRRIVSMTPVTGEIWYMSYSKNPSATTWRDSHVLYVYFMTDGPQRRRSTRTYRQTIFSNEEWVHIAWVWGPLEAALVAGTKREAIITTRVFINGKLGRQYNWHGVGWRGHAPADMPKELYMAHIKAAYDELRISDVQRYDGEFTPPARDREFAVDEHTRALFHFNGDTQGQTHGLTAPVMGEIRYY